MKILIVCSENSGKIAPFIIEQVDSIRNLSNDVEFFTVKQKGFLGYLRSRKPLLSKIKDFQPDIIHAHYGLSGLLANLQRKVPVVATYHGSDINNPKVLRFSRLSVQLSKHNIFVSEKNIRIADVNKKHSLIPCGIDTAVFAPKDKSDARTKLGLDTEKNYILFAGSFSNDVKNPALAIEAVKLVPNAELIELKGYTREEVALLMNAVDVCLMTSHTEGSPQFIKEAMACNCPIVSVDVGDVKEVISEVEGCYMVNYDAVEVASDLQKALGFNTRTNGRKRIEELKLDLSEVAKRVVDVYKMCMLS